MQDIGGPTKKRGKENMQGNDEGRSKMTVVNRPTSQAPREIPLQHTKLIGYLRGMKILSYTMWGELKNIVVTMAQETKQM